MPLQSHKKRTILDWLSDGPRPDGVPPIPPGTPVWLDVPSLPVASIEGTPLPWRHAVSLAAVGVPGTEEVCAAIVRQRLQKRGVAAPVFDAALQGLSDTARLRLLHRAVADTLCRADDAGARLMMEVADQCLSPRVWSVLCAACLWPRGGDFQRALRARLASRDADGDWRALLLNNLTEGLPDPFGFAGFTAPADGTPGALRAALMEEAMCSRARWERDLWRRRIGPAVGDMQLLTVTDEGGVGILHPAESDHPLTPRRDEPFLQTRRPVFRPHDPSARIVRRFRDRVLADEHIRSPLNQRGWRWGESVDYPGVFERFRPIYDADWCVYVRLNPGLYRRVRPDPIQVFSVCFLRGASSRPQWGGEWTTMTRDGRQMHDPEPGTGWLPPEQLIGARLGEVPPAIFSEALWFLTTLHTRHSHPAD